MTGKPEIARFAAIGKKYNCRTIGILAALTPESCAG